MMAQLGLVLKDNAEVHDVLEACVNGGVKLKRFEPKQASLHEAFVAMVGQDVVDTLGVDALDETIGAAS